MYSPLVWASFIAAILVLLALDLGVFHRKSHKVEFREAVTWSVIWVSLALAFNFGLYLWQGPKPALEFFTGYLVEKSLSVDNIFIFVLLFTYFRVPPQFQHRVLFWGVVGALIMRGALILIGAVLLARFHWILYLFGAFLVLTGIKLFVMKGKEMDPGKNPMVKLLKRLMPFTPDYHGSKFFVRKEGLLVATPLFLVLILVETTDLIFALDSIPAIFGITRDPFIVFSSNVFAILGLRSLYFLLAGVMNRFHYLHYGLALVLIFIGTKMMIADLYKIPVGISLGVIALILGTSVAASLMKPVPEGKEGDQLSEEGEIPEPQPAAGALH